MTRTIDPNLPKRHVKWLQVSIQHWKENEEREAEGEELDLNYCSCECCMRAMEEIETDELAKACPYCPIGQYTGLIQCRGTPYKDIASPGLRYEPTPPARMMTAWLEQLLYGEKPEIWTS